jgi:hypothetical protein
MPTLSTTAAGASIETSRAPAAIHAAARVGRHLTATPMALVRRQRIRATRYPASRSRRLASTWPVSDRSARRTDGYARRSRSEPYRTSPNCLKRSIGGKPQSTSEFAERRNLCPRDDVSRKLTRRRHGRAIGRRADPEVDKRRDPRRGLTQSKERAMAGTRDDALLSVELSKWGAMMGLPDASRTIFSEDFDAETAEMTDAGVQVVFAFNETVATLVKNGLLDRTWFMTGSGSSAPGRESAAQPSGRASAPAPPISSRTTSSSPSRLRKPGPVVKKGAPSEFAAARDHAASRLLPARLREGNDAVVSAAGSAVDNAAGTVAPALRLGRVEQQLDQQRHRLAVLRHRQRHPPRRQQPDLTSRVLLRQSSSGRQRSQGQTSYVCGPAWRGPLTREKPLAALGVTGSETIPLYRQALLTLQKSQRPAQDLQNPSICARGGARPPAVYFRA